MDRVSQLKIRLDEKIDEYAKQYSEKRLDALSIKCEIYRLQEEIARCQNAQVNLFGLHI